jgi:hypothetical protein
MYQQEDVEYHRRRATKELDCGLTAKHIGAARTHLKLASMHLQRVRELDPTASRDKPFLRM